MTSTSKPNIFGPCSSAKGKKGPTVSKQEAVARANRGPKGSERGVPSSKGFDLSANDGGKSGLKIRKG